MSLGIRTVLAASIALCVCIPASAVIGAIDPVPAATLLLPYFEVDGNAGNSFTTLFTVTNTSSSSGIAHVVLWTDIGVPTFAFDVALAPHDVQSVNLRRIFDGFIPSGSGSIAISQDDVDQMRASHSGEMQPLTFRCAGVQYGDGVYRGYVTVDSVAVTSNLFPSDAGYFVNGGSGIADNRNILWGEYQRLDPLNNFASGETMVHIEAASSDVRVTTPGNYTFYGGMLSGSAADNREPLGSQWVFPFSNDGDTNTDIIYWRDIRAMQRTVTCGTLPGWFPLLFEHVTLFQSAYEIENPYVPAAFPAVCGRTAIDSPNIPTALSNGFLLLDLDHVFGFSVIKPAQSYVTIQQYSQGRFSTEVPGALIQTSIAP